MASERAPVSTAASVPVHLDLSSISSGLAGTTASKTPAALHCPKTPDISYARLLKPANPRSDQSPNLPALTSIANAGLRTSPQPISLKSRSPAYTPPPMTGAAGMADMRRKQREEQERGQAKQTSVNPGKAALGALLGAETGMSRASDAPSATNTMSEAMTTAAKAISIPEPMQVDSNTQSSPVSMTTSIVASPGSTAPTATANSADAVSPNTGNQMKRRRGSSDSQEEAAHAARAHGPEDNTHSNRAFTFPGPLLASSTSESLHTPMRGSSLPMAGYNNNHNNSNDSPKSSSTRKHKCPYCSTDFTRHHNLKSHLLTHSQEKPYVCQNCQSRFRRLHDLKRHSKLHTGERPHRCPRCGRQFARGDALARHNKGQGGCAGRRASMGSYTGDDDFGEGPSDAMQSGNQGDDSTMDGLAYAHEQSHPDDAAEALEEARRSSLPVIKAQEISPAARMHNGTGQSEQTFYQPQFPQTYPPAPGRSLMNATNSLHPTVARHQAESASTSASPSIKTSTLSPKTANTSNSSAPMSAVGGASMFSQGGMTESPKPLSPGAMGIHQLGHSDSQRRRSPSFTQQMQRLPPPPANANPNAPQLPPLAPPESRYTLSSQVPGAQPHGQSGSHTSQGATMTAASSSLSNYHSAPGGGPPPAASHGRTEGNTHMSTSPSPDVWLYIRGLEDKVNRLEGEVVSLKNQMVAHDRRESQGGARGATK
ncbi:MAG: hypothetical protein M1824_002564 [Vezdaea acicularis]|nr:MAG: hypothetical protein M1824_002564 [Vezdaea acicularis]